MRRKRSRPVLRGAVGKVPGNREMTGNSLAAYYTSRPVRWGAVGKVPLVDRPSGNSLAAYPTVKKIALPMIGLPMWEMVRG
jgi:hypothetical protein